MKPKTSGFDYSSSFQIKSILRYDFSFGIFSLSAGCGSFQNSPPTPAGSSDNISMIQLFYCVTSTILWYFLFALFKYRCIIEISRLLSALPELRCETIKFIFRLYSSLMEFRSLLWFLISDIYSNVGSRTWNNRMHTAPPQRAHNKRNHHKCALNKYSDWVKIWGEAGKFSMSHCVWLFSTIFIFYLL